MSRERGLVFGALCVLALAAVLAVVEAYGSPNATSSGVEAASAAIVTRTVVVDGTKVSFTSKPGGRVCYSAPHVSSCGSLELAGQISFATGTDGDRRTVIAGVAGSKVRSVIAKLSGGGVVWPKLENGVFYAVLPKGFALRSVVKVLVNGHRVSFPA